MTVGLKDRGVTHYATAAYLIIKKIAHLSLAETQDTKTIFSK
jgi:hypothetical protein